MVWRRSLDGEVGIEEVLTVVRAEFNRPIDQDVFTIKKMDIPPGTSVIEVPRHATSSRMWDGQELVPVRGIPDPVTERQDPTRRSRFFIVLSLNCAVIAFLVLVFYFRRRRAKD